MENASRIIGNFIIKEEADTGCNTDNLLYNLKILSMDRENLQLLGVH